MRRWAVCLVAALSPHVLGQQPPPKIPRLGESIEVSIVNVDVFVTDREGRRVRGLAKDDFEIFEDGKRQPITNFAEYRGEQPLGQTTVSGAPEPEPQTPPSQKRTIIIFVDRFSLPRFSSEPTFNAIRSFLRQAVKPGDAVSIVSWRQQALTRLPFTDDLAAIENVLGRIEKENSFISGDEQAQITAERDFQRQMVEFAARQGVIIDRLEGATFTGQSAAMRAKFDMRRKVSAIDALISGISAAEGTKALILATHRFSRVAGKEYLVGLHATLIPNRPQELEYDMSKEIEEVTRTANANNVRIYALYPEGMGSEGLTRADLTEAPSQVFDHIVLDNELSAMGEVSQKTGGTLAWGSQDIVRVLPGIGDDFNSYYSLAYRATASGTDRAHKIVVKVKNPNYTVRSRGEYVEKSDTTRMKDRVVANLFGSAARGTIPLAVSLGTAEAKGKGRWTQPVVVSFPSASLMTVPQKSGHAGAFSVYVGWGNALGQVGEITHQTRPFQIPPDQVENANALTFTYQFELFVDEKTSLLSIGLMDEVAKEFGLARVELPRTTK